MYCYFFLQPVTNRHNHQSRQTFECLLWMSGDKNCIKESDLQCYDDENEKVMIGEKISTSGFDAKNENK